MKYFEGLGKFRQKQWLYRLHNAKLPETRKQTELQNSVAEAMEKKNNNDYTNLNSRITRIKKEDT